jgi:hypothetical protein
MGKSVLGEKSPAPDEGAGVVMDDLWELPSNRPRIEFPGPSYCSLCSGILQEWFQLPNVSERIVTFFCMHNFYNPEQMVRFAPELMTVND